MKKKITILFLLSALFLKFYSQDVLSSNTFIQTCLHNRQCYSINNSSYLFYDESRNVFFLKIDFSKFKTGQDTIDDWLDDLSSTFLYFKAPMDKEIFQSGFANHHTKILKLHGQAFLNAIWHNQDIELSLFTTDNSVISNNSNSNYSSFKVNFSLSIHPKEYKIHKKPHHLKKTILIGVTLGRINLLQPGSEVINKDVLEHH
jgi:hypothetical protein